MARPLKKGIVYFPLDVTFLRNIKVRKIMKACSERSIAVLVSLLSRIYEERGYYTEWDNDISFLIADEIGVSEGLVAEVVTKAVQVEFFDIDKFEKENILTSKGIQNRYLEATTRRTSIDLIEEYLLLDINVVSNLDNVNINSINDDKSTQRRVEKSRLDESREDESNTSSSDFFSQLIEKWNLIDTIPNIQAINTGTKRERMLKARRNQYGDSDVLKAIDNIQKSDFLQGKVNEFAITFDWFVKPNNFIKVLEGNYDNKKNDAAKPNDPSKRDEWQYLGDFPY